MSNNDNLPPILATARELYGRSVYSHKVHEIEREIWSAKVYLMNYTNIGLASATTFAAILSVALPTRTATYLTAVFSVMTVCFVMWQSNLDPGTKEARQRVTAKELLWLREQFLLFIADCHVSQVSYEHLQRRLEMLTRELTATYKFAPDTSQKAYEKARRLLQTGHFTFSDDDIDQFLPADLRRSKPSPHQ